MLGIYLLRKYEGENLSINHLEGEVPPFIPLTSASQDYYLNIHPEGYIIMPSTYQVFFFFLKKTFFIKAKIEG